ncbi:hypothetical protein [Polymorphobacter sp.]|uniref:hypothetical protein n=1 Tax=Polymorphobacter sp. TaxID=1909290 RepID=UPI003F71B3A7
MSIGSPALASRGGGRLALAVVAAGLTATAVYSASRGLSGGPAARLQRALGPAFSQASPAPVEPALAEEARAVLAAQPLSPLPFIVAARDASARGEVVTATGQYERALLRNPRNVGVRLWLAERYLRDARFADVVVQLDAVMRIRPSLRRGLVSVIVPLVGAPAGRQAIAAALARNPIWKADFLDAAPRQPAVAPAFYELIHELGGLRGFSLSDAQLSRIVTTALARGHHASAWSLYTRFAPRAVSDPDNKVFDANFRGAAGPPPFNWEFASTASGFAQVDPLGVDGRLTVQIFGGEPATLATQKMILVPGTYRLSTTGVPEAGTVDGLAWRLVCDRTRAELGSLAIDNGVWSGRPASVAIAVPALCPVATLRLAYVPQVRTELGTAAIGSVMLERIETPSS